MGIKFTKFYKRKSFHGVKKERQLYLCQECEELKLQVEVSSELWGRPYIFTEDDWINKKNCKNSTCVRFSLGKKNVILY